MERKEGGGKRKRKTQEQERKKLPETYYSSNVAITLPVMLLDYQNLYLTNDSRECSSRPQLLFSISFRSLKSVVTLMEKKSFLEFSSSTTNALAL